jgi:hypothetical protein
VRLVRELQHSYIDRVGKFGESDQDLNRRLPGELVEVNAHQLAEFRRRGFVFAFTHASYDTSASATPRRAATISLLQVSITLRSFSLTAHVRGIAFIRALNVSRIRQKPHAASQYIRSSAVTCLGRIALPRYPLLIASLPVILGH